MIGMVFLVPIVLQRPLDDPKAQWPQSEATRDVASEQFNTFQFWREPLPALDSELLGLLVGSAVCHSTRVSGSLMHSGSNWVLVSWFRS